MTLQFNHNGCDYRIELSPDDSDYWITIDEFDIHYCEDYNEVCVYEQGNTDRSVYSIKIK